MKSFSTPVLVLVLALCSASATAHADEPLRTPPRGHCGWSAIPGALLGATVGAWGTYGVLRLAGNNTDELKHATDGRFVALMSGMTAGAVLGPIASCAVFEPEDHAVPRITFILGGAALGGLGAGVGTYALTNSRVRDARTEDQRFSASEGQAGLVGLAATLGAAGGAVGGYYLYNALYPAPSDSGAHALLLPAVTHNSAALHWVGAF